MRHSLFKSLATVVLAVASLQATAYDFETDGIFYEITSSTEYTVATTYGSSYGSYSAETVTIPSTVTYNEVEYTVAQIGMSTFRSSTNVKTVVIPNTVTAIGDQSFRDCTGLTSLEIPSSVLTTGSYMCYGCTSLTSVTLNEGLTSIGSYSFYGCTSLPSLDVPGTVTTIGQYACYGCTSLQSITLGTGLTSLSMYMLYGCTSLTEVDIPATVTSIDKYAFAGCTGLTSVSIPAAVSSISVYSFEQCTGLGEITVDEDNAVYASIDGALYSKDQATLIIYPAGKQTFSIPSSVTAIGMSACRYCSNITSVELPASVSSVESFAFADCSNLTSVSLSADIDSLLNYTFYRCYALESVVMPDSLTYMGGWVFSTCRSLSEITLPSKLAEMSYSCFYNDSALMTINALNPLPATIESNSFNSYILSNATLYVPIGAADAYKAADYWSGFSNIEEKDFSTTTTTYTITSAAEWNALADLMATEGTDLTGTVVLIANDIDFSDEAIKPLGYDRVSVFNGELDGNGKILSGITGTPDANYYGSVIVATGSEAYVHDITVEGSITSAKSYTGGSGRQPIWPSLQCNVSHDGGIH